ncbi:acyltransferase family protein [Faecalicoccus pleomorphus]|uniref:acyltransferase family protein n=1 Tax=Faecalicoccus pleomorphus TaxID=1323 RepID=UPI00195FAD52|nr:acyltransferase [Faecalicoccus pleomorphus]MBM6677770.1 acyltransferase [Faecalicoccus pleomorphus]
MMKKEHYGAIDGLRTIACIGIVMMHVAANTDYSITGFFYNSMIPSFTNFVFLFMTISAFGMCCGYYHKMLNNQINLSDFYAKRFKKILPFFALLVLIDVLLSPSLNAIYEAFADLTLLFGFLPNAGNISVIGVGWFLGLIFVFYICFPFYCVLIKNKKRAWIAFFLSLIFNFVCSVYFDVGRTNILYSSCYLIAGGLIYLYRTNIRSLNQWALLVAVLFSVVLYYLIGANTLTCLLVSSSLLIYAIFNRGGVLQNKFTAFISTISMEMYLSHMVIFRIVEKLGLHQVIGNDWLQYCLTLIIVLFGTVIFSIVAQKILHIFITKFDQLLA